MSAKSSRFFTMAMMLAVMFVLVQGAWDESAAARRRGIVVKEIPSAKQSDEPGQPRPVADDTPINPADSMKSKNGGASTQPKPHGKQERN